MERDDRTPDAERREVEVVSVEPIEVEARPRDAAEELLRGFQQQQGPFVFRQYTRTYAGGGPGCGCGCLLAAFLMFLLVRGFLSLF